MTRRRRNQYRHRRREFTVNLFQAERALFVARKSAGEDVMNVSDAINLAQTPEQIHENVRFDAFALPRMFGLANPHDGRKAIAILNPPIANRHRLKKRVFGWQVSVRSGISP